MFTARTATITEFQFTPKPGGYRPPGFLLFNLNNNLRYSYVSSRAMACRR